MAEFPIQNHRHTGNDFPKVRAADLDDRAMAVAIKDEATVQLNAASGYIFTLDATGDRTIAAPTNARDGQRMVVRHRASGGARTLSLASGTGGFSFGTDITALTATGSGLVDYITCAYDVTSQRWHVVGYVKGYST